MKDKPPFTPSASQSEAYRGVGVHLRIEKSYTDMLKQAAEIGTNICQFFFMPQDTNKYLRLTKKDREEFFAHNHHTIAYAHSSYWINLATGDATSSQISRTMLKKEITIAKKLNINHIVMHAGSAKGHEKENGIQAVANILNKVLKNEETVTILIENTAHGGKSVCSDLQDFVALRKLLTTSQVKFCLDTTHAYAYGYNLDQTNEFATLLDQTMGLENIELIHLNDSAKKCGSKIDQHALPGKGLIGKQALQNIINHPKLAHIPIIIEPPVVPLEELQAVIRDVRGW